MTHRRGIPPIWLGLIDLLLLVLNVLIVQVAPLHAKQDGVVERALYLVTIEWDSSIDADVDLHLLLPSRKPVFYGARQIGLVTLDTDNKGLADSTVQLADGTYAKLKADKEIIKIGAAVPGHYDAGANLFGYRVDGIAPPVGLLGLKVHCELIAIEPSVHLVFAKDVTLDHVGETVNWVSFDMDREGAIVLTDPPLTPITDIYSHPNAMAPHPATGGNQGP